jgi:electron transport complex protein RnfG
MPKFVKDALILCAITLIAGLLLGLVYEVTKAPRAEQEEKKQAEACEAVMKVADSFESYEYDGEACAAYIEAAGITTSEVLVDSVMEAKASDGSVMGYVITVTAREGYGGDIQFTVGMLMDKTVTGVSILSIGETPGLGMKADSDDFLGQFENLKSAKIGYSKTGKAEATDDYAEIDAISGATITTKAMVKGVNTAITCFSFLTDKVVANE